MGYLLISIAGFIFVGIPIAFSIGFGSFVYVWMTGEASTTIIVQKMIDGVNSFSLLAVPIFILMGELMVKGGAIKRLMGLPNVLLGRFTGGLGYANVGTGVILGGISGSGVADVAALSTVFGPEMEKKGFAKGFIASLQGCSGVLAVVIPPSIVLILIGVSGGVSIGDLFLAGIIPGILTAVLLMVYVYIYAKKNNIRDEAKPEKGAYKKAILESILPLGMPVVILGGILLGIFTATESAAIATIYAFVLTRYIYRELTYKHIKEALFSTVLNTGAIMILISASTAFAWVLTRAQVTQRLLAFFLEISTSPFVIFTLMMLLLLILGIVIEATPIVLITTPILMPIAIEIGMDPVHFGVLMAMNLAIGSNTPPMALSLLTACRILKVKVEDTLPYILYFISFMLLALIIVAIFPSLALFLPSLNQ